ncbi:hypothetical protein LNI98_06295 [Tenacibaculum dicentrarchi]|nr:hypothetical protein [Tenacibaculum dicentrarchi]
MNKEKKHKIKEIPLKGLKELLFKTGNNAINISKEFEFDKEQEFYILNKFWPIFKLNNVTLNQITEQLIKLKKNFINCTGEFDIDIFKRDIDLGSFEYEINEYLNSFKKRDVNLWQTVKGKHFITFSFDKDPVQWLIITDKNYVQLEIYFKNILSLLNNFCNKIQTKKEPQKIKLSIKQVALKYIYEGKHITRQNSNSIIKEYGHTSGDKLYNEYTRYSSKTNRTGNENTQKKLENKIKLIESVISLLSIENQDKPKKEITDLKAKLIID